MKCWLIWGTLLLTGWGTLTAQTCDLQLSGKVFELEQELPIPFAQVRLVETDQVALTDENGVFHFKELCPGQYTLVCEHSAYARHELLHDLEEDHDVTINLEAGSKNLDTVVVLGHRAAAEALQSKQVLDKVTLAETRGQDLASAVARLPGVSILRTGGNIGKPVVHGLHSNRVVILNNGIPLEGQQWGSEHAPEIDPFLASSIALIKGAESVRYGAGAMGGVILVEPRPLGDSLQFGGKVHLVGQSNGRQGIVSGQLHGGLGKHPGWKWRVQGTLKKGGNLRAPNYFLENTGERGQNFSGTLRYQSWKKGLEIFYSRFHTRLGILSSAHLGGRSDLEAALESPIPIGADTVGFTYDLKRPYQDITHNLAKAKAYWRLPGGRLDVVYAYQYNRRREFDKHKPRGRDENGQDKAELDFQIHTHFLEGLWKHEPWKGMLGTWGVSGLYQNNYLNGRPFIPNFVAFNGAVFGSERLKLGRWEWEAGLRYDYRWVHSAREVRGQDIFEIQDFQSVSWNLGGMVKVSELFHLKAHLGRAWRPPHVNELFSDGLHHGAGTVEIGNPDLDAEQALKGIASLEWFPGQNWQIDLSTYYQRFGNFIYKRPDGLAVTVRGTFPQLTYVQTPARLQGADLSLRYQPKAGLTWEGQASWLDALDLNNGQPLIYMPANWWESTLGYQIGPKGTHVVSYLKVGLRQVAEQTRVPIAASPEEDDWLPPPAGYTIWHLRWATEWELGNKRRLEIGGRVDNLFNLAYRDYLNRFRYFSDELGRNIQLRVSLLF
ncbi:MAG: TonB-dependent receptor [Bacteroidota bacterium]